MKNVYITLWQIYAKHCAPNFIQNWPSCAEDMAKHFGLLFLVQTVDFHIPLPFTTAANLYNESLRSQVVLCNTLRSLVPCQ